MFFLEPAENSKTKNCFQKNNFFFKRIPKSLDSKVHNVNPKQLRQTIFLSRAEDNSNHGKNYFMEHTVHPDTELVRVARVAARRPQRGVRRRSGSEGGS